MKEIEDCHNKCQSIWLCFVHWHCFWNHLKRKSKFTRICRSIKEQTKKFYDKIMLNVTESLFQDDIMGKCIHRRNVAFNQNHKLISFKFCFVVCSLTKYINNLVLLNRKRVCASQFNLHFWHNEKILSLILESHLRCLTTETHSAMFPSFNLIKSIDNLTTKCTLPWKAVLLVVRYSILHFFFVVHVFFCAYRGAYHVKQERDEEELGKIYNRIMDCVDSIYLIYNVLWWRWWWWWCWISRCCRETNVRVFVNHYFAEGMIESLSVYILKLLRKPHILTRWCCCSSAHFYTIFRQIFLGHKHLWSKMSISISKWRKLSARYELKVTRRHNVISFSLQANYYSFDVQFVNFNSLRWSQNNLHKSARKNVIFYGIDGRASN